MPTDLVAIAESFGPYLPDPNVPSNTPMDSASYCPRCRHLVDPDGTAAAARNADGVRARQDARTITDLMDERAAMIEVLYAIKTIVSSALGRRT